jgi:hypothetical protein
MAVRYAPAPPIRAPNQVTRDDRLPQYRRGKTIMRRRPHRQFQKDVFGLSIE